MERCGRIMAELNVTHSPDGVTANPKSIGEGEACPQSKV